MKIGIVGLGLIGGSLAKAFKKYTDHLIFVYDINESVVNKAISEKNADGTLLGNLRGMDLLVLALYPDHSIEFIKAHKEEIGKDTVVTDCAGIKQKVCEKISVIAKEQGFTFIGGHPMAGIEKSGYDASTYSLFKGASMILTPEKDTDVSKILFVQEALKPLGFTRFQMSTPAQHDRIIAYTSQLAHIVSSAYILSPAANEHLGFSAGSFRDMTRVAKLNEYMWTELFLENKENLCDEIELLINGLTEFEEAIKSSDEEKLCSMLKKGRLRKEKINDMEKNQ